MLIEATSDLETLISRNSSVKEMLDTKEKEVEELVRQTEVMRSEAQILFRTCRDLLETPDMELRDWLRALPPDQPYEELESEIDSERARLELMHEGNGGIIREYEIRKRKIDALSGKLEEWKGVLTELDEKIKELRDQWEPELDALVEKISDSFSSNMEQISCAGEVGVHKDDDFDQWAIQIRVKFRYVSLLLSHYTCSPFLPRYLLSSYKSFAHM